MARFVKFGAEVDEATQLQLTRGERARALLGQDQHVPMPLEDELVSLYAVVNGYLDKVAVADLPATEARILAWVAARCPQVMRELATGKSLSEEATSALQTELAAFVATLSEGE